MNCSKLENITLINEVSITNPVSLTAPEQDSQTSESIICRNDELSWMMSWIGCLLIDSVQYQIHES